MYICIYTHAHTHVYIIIEIRILKVHSCLEPLEYFETIEIS